MKSCNIQPSPLVADASITATPLTQRPVGEVIDFIVDTHHAYTRTAMEKISRLLVKVIAKHGDQHPQLAGVARAFDVLAAEMGPHMAREERILFPFIRALGEPGRQVAVPPFGTIRNPVRVMMDDHERTTELLASIGAATGQFTPPAGVCAGVTTLYAALSQLSSDFLRHAALENDVLFPRAIALELQKYRGTSPE